MLPLSTVSIWCATALALVGCSKSSTEKTEVGSAAPPAGSAKPSSPPPESAAPEEAAAVVAGPTRSATGSLELTGAITGTFEWKRRDQRSPISCAWDPAKEIGGVRVDVSDGAGKIVSLAVDVPPIDAGLPRLDVSSKDLATPLKSSLGFNVSGESSELIAVKFVDTKLGDDEKKPDLTIKGTLEISCPKKK